MDLLELKIYQLALDMGRCIWNIAIQWKDFEKHTMGSQIIRSADSIAANISEGFGRYHYLDKQRFYYYARGSLYETMTWMTKAHERKLVNQVTFDQFMDNYEQLKIKLHNFIRITCKTPTGRS
ncbi:MAG: four helix bundle protein [Flavobacteriales bacterium]|nr:four helix bundle protein [Flavobacteriales bacterium]MCB9448969.1 four helix bundle protein [Flavobacteriales bacterium]